MKLKILIAEDHEIFREGVRKVIETLDNVEKVYEATNGEACLKMVDEIKPDVIFMDIKMPLIDGIECTKIINDKYPEIKIIAFTMYNEEEYIESMLEAGAKGFLLKTCSVTEIKNSINAVMKGKNFFSEEVAQALANLYLKKKVI
ncbi:MAG: response regulator transcription factor [Bacteroidales bacterium]|nr:response regulator transcription factor [Bacteroidales bacterium]